jgi:hypothetical protein
MADIPPPNPPPGPTGAVQPPKKETGKVQPKKETVRINLPPKPAAAPTIKLPTLPPGGPTGAPSAAPAPTIAPVHATAPPPPKPPTGAPALTKSGPATAAPQQRPATMQRPAAAATGAPTIKTIDKVLIYVATVAVLGGVGFYGYVSWFVLKPLIDNFQQ